MNHNHEPVLRPNRLALFVLTTISMGFLLLTVGFCFDECHILPVNVYASQWNATLIPIVPGTIRSSLASTSATAASLLIAVLAFLYNGFRTLRQQDHDAYSRYLGTRLRYQKYVSEKLKGVSYTLNPKGGAGVKGDFDFEWTYDIYTPVTSSVARPETLLADLEGLFRQHIDVELVDSVNRNSLLDFSGENWLNSMILKESIRDVRVHLVWVFERQPTSGTLHVQTVFLSLLRKRMQSLRDSMRMMSIAIVMFVATVGLSFMSEFVNGCSYLALLTYSLGWGLILLGVRQFLLLVPTIHRRKEMKPLEGDIIIEIPAKEPVI